MLDGVRDGKRLGRVNEQAGDGDEEASHTRRSHDKS